VSGSAQPESTHHFCLRPPYGFWTYQPAFALFEAGGLQSAESMSFSKGGAVLESATDTQRSCSARSCRAQLLQSAGAGREAGLIIYNGSSSRPRSRSASCSASRGARILKDLKWLCWVLRRRSQSASPNLSLLTRRKWDSDLAHADALDFNSLLLADVTSLFSRLRPRLKDLFFWCTAKRQIRA
jgi:hypothetical protein